ncbi:unnamed protein product, partial [Closterium sp. NIES-53]
YAHWMNAAPVLLCHALSSPPLPSLHPPCPSPLAHSELNDTVVEAQLRTLHIPPLLPVAQCVDRFHQCRNRLLILGYNGTLTAQVEPHRRRTPDQIKEMKVSGRQRGVTVIYRDSDHRDDGRRRQVEGCLECGASRALDSLRTPPDPSACLLPSPRA